MAINEKICANCNYYEKLGDTEGACCYNPPAVIVQGDNRSIVNSAFPRVHPENRCGKFKPAPEV